MSRRLPTSRAKTGRPVVSRPLEAERPLPFRRRRFVAPRRRRGLLSLLKPLAMALLLVALPAAAAVWASVTPRFRLSRLEVVGSGQVTRDWVEEALAPLRGRHLLRLPLPEVERRLRQHPWVRGADIEKRLPDGLAVTVVERQPVALLRRDGSLHYVDREGVVFAPYDPDGAVDLLVLSAADGLTPSLDDVLEVVADLAAVDAEWAAGLSEIQLLAPGDYRLYLSAFPFPVLVSAGRARRGLRVLARLWPEIGRYGPVGQVDLRFEGQVVIKPAVGPPTGEG